jgi:hypothetical protein
VGQAIRGLSPSKARMPRRTGCAASVVVLVAGALIPLHEVSAQQSATTPPPPSQQESQTPLGRPIDIGTVPAEDRAATALTSPNEQWRHRKWDLVFDATTAPRSPALDERWPTPSDPIGWSMGARAQYKTHKSAFSVSVSGQRGSQFPTYLTESLDAQGRYAISSGALRELSGQHTWDVAFRVDRRLAETRGGATLDAFAQAFHPVGSKARSIDETPIACSSALFFGVAIGF